MKVLVSICICSLCLFLKSYSQKAVIDMFTKATVLLQYNNGISASGIMMADTNYYYLITARHALININGTNTTLIGKDAYIISYKNDAYTDSKDSLKLDLLQLFKNGNLVFNNQEDIAIIRLAKITSYRFDKEGLFEPKYSFLPGATKVKASNLELPGVYIDLLLKFTDIDPGDEAFMFGYPKSLKLEGNDSYDYDRPLLRKGIIAGLDKKLQTIIVDCPSYQGNSGGPVFEFSFDFKKIGLIGIVSSSILLVEKLENKYYQYNNINVSNSGYTVVIPIEFALQLIKTMK